MKATFTLGNINPNFLAGINNITAKAYTIAEAEKATKLLKQAIKAKADTSDLRVAISEGLDIELASVDDMISTLATLKTNTMKQAKAKSESLLSYYIDPTFVMEGSDIYHDFNAEEFLRNIGVISEGTLKSNKVRKVADFAEAVTDRVKAGYTDRFNGTDYVSTSEDKIMKNNALTFMLAILEGMYAGGLIDRTFTESEAGGRVSAYTYIPKQAEAGKEEGEAEA